MINFLFVCLYSVEDSYGLFEMFQHFKIGCGWSHRIIDVVSQPDVERLFAMMPGYRLTGHTWEKKSRSSAPGFGKVWTVDPSPISSVRFFRQSIRRHDRPRY